MRNVLNQIKHQFSDFSNFHFSSYRENSSKIGVVLSTKMTITWKIKIGKLIFHLFKHIPHLSCKFEHLKKMYATLSATLRAALHATLTRVQTGVWSPQRQDICCVKPICYCPFYFILWNFSLFFYMNEWNMFQTIYLHI